jgi:sulfur carrier protein
MSISGNQAKNRAMLQHEAQSETGIELVVNGRKIGSEARTLAALIEERGLANAKVATAVNGQFVPEARRATTALDRGDRVEIVSARQGG